MWAANSETSLGHNTQKLYVPAEARYSRHCGMAGVLVQFHQRQTRSTTSSAVPSKPWPPKPIGESGQGSEEEGRHILAWLRGWQQTLDPSILAKSLAIWPMGSTRDQSMDWDSGLA